MTTKIKEFTQYRRKQIAELRPYIEGEDVSHVSISQEDAKTGSPKRGDMIARNPKNHADQWLVAHAYFLDNFEPLPAAEQAEICPDCASVEKVRELLQEIIAKSRALRVGGPDPIDLHELSDALEEAIDLAVEADGILSALEPTESDPSSYYFPVPMPLDADGKGPASFEKGEVRKLVFEVWDQDFRTHGTFDSLLEAIAHANRLNAPTTCTKLEADRYEKRIVELEARKSSLSRLLSLIVDYAAEWKETLQWIDQELIDRGVSQSDPIRIKIQDALLMPENATELTKMLTECGALTTENEQP